MTIFDDELKCNRVARFESNQILIYFAQHHDDICRGSRQIKTRRDETPAKIWICTVFYPLIFAIALSDLLIFQLHAHVLHKKLLLTGIAIICSTCTSRFHDWRFHEK